MNINSLSYLQYLMFYCFFFPFLFFFWDYLFSFHLLCIIYILLLTVSCFLVLLSTEIFLFSLDSIMWVVCWFISAPCSYFLWHKMMAGVFWFIHMVFWYLLGLLSHRLTSYCFLFCSAWRPYHFLKNLETRNGILLRCWS